MIGADRLVPPTWAQPSRPCASPPASIVSHSAASRQLLYVSYTARPVRGSATAATSATVRRAQPRSCCHAGFGSYLEQPLPEPLHAVSDHPRAVEVLRSVVPPTAVT